MEGKKTNFPHMYNGIEFMNENNCNSHNELYQKTAESIGRKYSFQHLRGGKLIGLEHAFFVHVPPHFTLLVLQLFVGLSFLEV